MTKLIEKNRFKNLFIIIFFVILTLYLSYPFFYNINFQGHDFDFHMLRIQGISSGLTNGIFPIKIYPNYFHNYGYANGLFYPDLFLYFPAFLHYLGFKLIDSFRIFMICINFTTIFSIYISIYKISKSKFSGICGVILYALSPYRLIDIYPRYALGEILSFIFIPIAIWGIYEILFGDFKKWYIISIGFLGVINSHIISFALLCALSLIIFLINIKRLFLDKNRLCSLLTAVCTSVLLSLWFLVPLLEQLTKDSFKVNSSNVGENLVNYALKPVTLLNNFKISSYLPNWNIVPNNLILGYLLVILSLVCFIFTLKNKYKNKYYNFDYLCLFMALLSLFISSSLFPWKLFSEKLSFIQFSWRFLMFATLFTCLYISLEINKLINKKIYKLSFLGIILILSIISSYPNIKTIKSLPTLNSSDFKIYNASVGNAEYIPEGTNIDEILNRGNFITSNSEEFHISNYSKNGTRVNFNFISSSDNFYFDIPLLYYRGYTATITDKNNVKHNLEVTHNENNIIRVPIHNIKTGNISITYSSTKASKISYIISLITFIFIISFSLFKRKLLTNF